MYVIGDVGILEELDLHGFSYFGGPEDGSKQVQLSAGYAMPHDENARPLVAAAACALHSRPAGLPVACTSWGALADSELQLGCRGVVPTSTGGQARQGLTWPARRSAPSSWALTS